MDMMSKFSPNGEIIDDYRCALHDHHDHDRSQCCDPRIHHMVDPYMVLVDPWLTQSRQGVVKYPNYVNLASSSEEQPNETTTSPPPRKKYLSPLQASSKSISSKSTHYTSSSSPRNSHEVLVELEGMGGGGKVQLEIKYKSFETIEKEKNWWRLPFIGEFLRNNDFESTLRKLVGSEPIQAPQQQQAKLRAPAGQDASKHRKATSSSSLLEGSIRGEQGIKHPVRRKGMLKEGLQNFALMAFTSTGAFKFFQAQIMSEAKTSESKTKSVGEPLIEDWISDNEDENETEFKSKQRKPSFAKTKFVKSNEHVKIPREPSYLSDYKEIDGGFVAFGGDPKGGRIIGKDTECVVLSPDFKLLDENHVLLRVPRKDNMYSVDLKNIVPSGGLTCLFAKATLDESNLWHRRLGHINFKTINKLVKGNLVRGLPSNFFEINQTCVACQKGKQHRASCKTKIVISISQPLQMLHMDLFGPTFVKSLMKKMYCLVVTDDYSRFSWVFFLATKDETSEILKTFITGIENLIDLKVKVIRCDNGTEFKNKVMNQFCEMKGIKREFSVARTPQQNGVAERKNKTLIEAARTMLADSKLLTTFWAEVVNTACYVQNRVLVIKPHNKTPYELFLGRKPALSFMRPFGCPVTILNTIDHLGKFDGKADEGFFVGYSTNSKAFRVFNSRTRIVEENLHVKFSKETPNIAGNGPNWLFDIDALTKSMNYEPVVVGNQSNGIASTKACENAGKARVETVPGKDYILLLFFTQDPPVSSSSKDSPDAGFKPSGEEEKKDAEHLEYEDSEVPNIEEPRVNQEQDESINSTNNINNVSLTVKTASIEDNVVDENIVYGCVDDPNMPNLEEIVYSDADEDVDAEADMTNLDTHILVSPTPTTKIYKDHPLEQIIGDKHSAPQTRRMTKSVTDQVEPKKVIGTKWIYKNKKDERGIMVRNKARLVAQGYTQEEGIDYDEVFALVARIKAIRLFLAYASFKDFIVYQMDVNSAFLYGKIEEEVYLYQPLVFEDPKFPDRVYKVENALYGLHQAPRACYETLSTYLLDNRFQRGQIDKTLFIKRFKGDILLVQVYIDDIIFGSTKKSLCTEFEKLKHKKFQMSSMGELTFFFRILVTQKRMMEFHQSRKYVVKF
ncbi:putative ribonuclease H-like domain-containing protein [Tanacetum coccineum]